MTRLFALGLGWLALVACGGGSASTLGSSGNLTLSLSADYVPADADLASNRLVTEAPLSFRLSLTDAGEEAFDDMSGVTYTLDPTDGAELTVPEADEELPNDVTVEAHVPGTYTLTATKAGQTLDHFDLVFSDLDAMELVLHARPPGSDDFSPLTQATEGPTPVAFGTHLALVPIPLDDGTRLLGDLSVTVDGTPSWAVLPDVGITRLVEQEVYTDADHAVYLVGEGEVSLTVTDEGSGYAQTVIFEVAPPVE